MRISSDTKAKVNVFAVVLILIIGGAAAAVGLSLLFNNRTTEYEISIEISALEVASESGSVYNVVHSTSEGDRYYNPETGKFDLTAPSGKAVLYASATIGSKEKFSEAYVKDVQTAKVPAIGTTISDRTISFKVTSSADSETISIFLMMKGNSGSAYDSVADIFGDEAGQHGINISVDLKNNTEERTLTGNADSEITGLLKLTITTKVI